MPPRRAKKEAAAPAKLPLEDCRIVFSGTFVGGQDQHKKTAESLGANTTGTTIVQSVTHVIYSDKSADKISAKVKQAHGMSIPVVSIDWLLKTKETNARQPEKDYALDLSSLDAASDASVADADTASQTDGDDTRGTKRKRSPSPAQDGAKADGEEEDTLKRSKLETKRAMGEGQILKDKTVQIPVDAGAPYGYAVHVDPDGVIYDASLNLTNSTGNNNKFYRLQLLTQQNGRCAVWTRWGRVGESGQHALIDCPSLQDALQTFEKKFKDKSGLLWSNRGDNPKPKKYAFVEVNYKDESDDEEEAEGGAATKEEKEDQKPPKCTLHPSVAKLMELIFNQQLMDNTMAALKYDRNKLPLGKLSKATIMRGFQALKNLSELFADPTKASQYGLPYQQAVEHLSNTYYSVIPHAFGRDRPPVIAADEQLRQEIELLENLSDMKEASNIMRIDKTQFDVHPLDRQYQGLKMQEMTPLDRASTEFAQLADYLVETRGNTHGLNYQVEEIFRIERQGEFDRFDQSDYADGKMKLKKNRKLLWHGSRSTNFGGILSQGLRIAPPEAPVNGYMFGKGVYLADMSSKSAGYCCAYLSNGTALLLLCEAELGDPIQELTGADYNAGEHAKQNGMLSTWGKGGTGPLKWKDAGVVNPALQGVMMPDTSVKPGNTNVPGCSLLYNEYIAYDVAQIRLRYLFRVKIA
ncbi:PARP-domain-containing protein [Neurospora hispaniola]|uniref:Poly [ADP-ribose] polymerase n=1 Tax=Neurospora hispaniola TaxID=588809 RepID=A0AAJ0MUZ7_9PEZI|nr:PARP-domain-containing protein [Neurospora hispaniola]